MELLKLNTIVIDPDDETRQRLCEVLEISEEFIDIQPASSFVNAKTLVEKSVKVDAIFIASHLNTHEITSFMSEMSHFLPTRDASIILLLNTSDQEKSFVSNRHLEGVDGFLAEPYSVSSLKKLALLTSKTQKKKRDARENLALEHLLPEIVFLIDQIASLKQSGFAAKISMETFREMCSALHQLPDELKDKYLDQVVSAFDEAELVSTEVVDDSSREKASNKITSAMNQLHEAFEILRKKIA